MRLAKGDLQLALSMYKGGSHKPQAQKYAAHTIGIYERLRSWKQGGTGDGDK